MAKRVFKAKKKLSGGLTNYRKWEEWKVDDTVVGEFIEQGEDDTYGKPKWTIKVEEAMFVGKPKTSAKLKGQNLTLNSNGMLDKAMAKIEPGDMVQIVYQGKGRLDKGKFKGKDAHKVEVTLLEEDMGEEELNGEEEEDFDL